MDGYVIKVSTEQLQRVSADVLEKIGKVSDEFNQLSAVLSNSKQHWTGNGNVSMRNAYNIRKDDYERIFNEMKEYVKKLQTIAGVYQETEIANVDMMGDLPGDVII